MTPIEPLPGLSRIAADYDAVLCDVWGVVHDGLRAHEAAADALTRFREHGAAVLITNAPRPSAPVVAQLDRLGVPRAAYDAIVSSGDVVRAHLATLGPVSVYHLGPERDLPLYEGLPVTLAENADAADLVVGAGMRNDDTDDPESYRAELAAIAALKLPFVCANPDIVVERGDRLVWCAGALAAIYEEFGGRAEQFGKPHAPIYAAALTAAGQRSAVDRVLAIGDGLPTDITGANRQGFDALFVVMGIHAAELAEADAAAVGARLAEDGLTARYYAPRLVW